MSPRSTTESCPAFARIGLRENPGRNLNQASRRFLMFAITFTVIAGAIATISSRIAVFSSSSVCDRCLQTYAFKWSQRKKSQGARSYRSLGQSQCNRISSREYDAGNFYGCPEDGTSRILWISSLSAAVAVSPLLSTPQHMPQEADARATSFAAPNHGRPSPPSAGHLATIVPDMYICYQAVHLHDDPSEEEPGMISVIVLDEVTGEWRKLHNAELHALYSSPDIIRNIKSRRLRWAGHVACMGESRNAYRVLVGRPEGNRPLGRSRRRWEGNIKMDLREVGYDDRDWINLAQDRDQWRAYVRAAMNLRVP
ncbi:hypothetical protein ANN_12203 [Periplaneta americana]|uniref:Uncharacterized protein n=1 Tax=Periplaneta americana TaxID=6978 RepID=A0ABQ8TGW8_PERAM|nr:hypothetical protein ANN_12203 [Periplaneta americana]